jgi:hypothetical protein
MHNDNEFCIVPDPPGLLAALQVPTDLRSGHFHKDGVEQGQKWQGWHLCVLWVLVSPVDGLYQVITQGAKPTATNGCIVQVPNFPARPEVLAVNASASCSTDQIAQLWDAGRELFGLINSRRPGRPKARVNGLSFEEWIALATDWKKQRDTGRTYQSIARRNKRNWQTVRKWIEDVTLVHSAAERDEPPPFSW